MYARITTYQIDPKRIHEMDEMLAELKGKCSSLPGILIYHTVWRDDGKGISTNIYDSRKSADEATLILKGIWAQFSDILTEKPRTEIFNHTKNMLYS